MKRQEKHFGQLSIMQEGDRGIPMQAYAYRGDKLQALEWLNRAAADHENVMWTVRTDPMLRTLAGDDGFRAWLSKINFQELTQSGYWLTRRHDRFMKMS